jgi:hypothetical protein
MSKILYVIKETIALPVWEFVAAFVTADDNSYDV